MRLNITSHVIEEPITIKHAIDKIVAREYLLPAIQRKFIWSTEQICVLFDSILRNYPINTLMSWSVTDKSIKKEQKFYEFLQTYCQRFKEDNPLFDTNGCKDFEAIIDGQQRLTSIYIGLKGTYAEKVSGKHWPTEINSVIFPPKSLYLDLLGLNNPEEDEDGMLYRFDFLSVKELEDKQKDKGSFWFKVGNILSFETNNDVLQYVEEKIEDSLKRDMASRILRRLFEEVHVDKQLHFQTIKSEDTDAVLNIFLRTNNGGTKLSFADLLTSIAIAHWKNGDFRQQLDELSLKLLRDSETNNYVNRDWILKTCLMLVDEEVRFKVKNFNEKCLEKIEEQWEEIKACIFETFKFLKNQGFDEESKALSAKNAAMPIAYYLYKQTYKGLKLYKQINQPHFVDLNVEKELITHWLCVSLLRGAFGGQGDSVLTKVRKIINDNCFPIKDKSDDVFSQRISEHFPFEAIRVAFKNDNRSIEFDEESIDNLVSTRKDDRHCRPLLHLIFPSIRGMETFHIDHMHPSSKFMRKNEETQERSDKDRPYFDKDQPYWDSLPNLMLLSNTLNQSKNGLSLEDWLSKSEEHRKNVCVQEQFLLPEEFDVSFENFANFYEDRKIELRKKLAQRVGVKLLST